MNTEKLKLIFEDDFSKGLNTDAWEVCEKSYQASAPAQSVFEPTHVRVANGAFKVFKDLDYTKDNVAVRDSRLYITGKRNGDGFTSGMIKLKDFAFKYGRVEVVAKAPKRGNGLLPRVRLVTFDGCTDSYTTSFDILAIFGDTDNSHPRLHSWAYERSSKNINHLNYFCSRDFGVKKEGDGSTPLDEEFHTFGFDWTDELAVYTFDGKPYFTYSMKNPVVDKPFKQPRTIEIGMPVGSCEISAPDENTVFPAEFIIDSVRIYGLED